jgi:hypothetical protein
MENEKERVLLRRGFLIGEFEKHPGAAWVL